MRGYKISENSTPQGFLLIFGVDWCTIKRHLKIKINHKGRMSMEKGIIRAAAGMLKCLMLVLAVLLCALPPKAHATDVQYKNFETIVGTGGVSKVLENERSPEWDNLKIRTDYTDTSGASDEVVSKTGDKQGTTWDGEKWDAGFYRSVMEGLIFGAYANNDNGPSNNNPSRAGWIQGLIYADVFPVGTRPDGVFINHNLDGLGGIPIA